MKWDGIVSKYDEEGGCAGCGGVLVAGGRGTRRPNIFVATEYKQ